MGIAKYIVLFKSTKNFKYLFHAVLMVIKQGRLPEVLWSIYCLMRYRPSAIVKLTSKDKLIQKAITKIKNNSSNTLSRQEVLEQYGDDFPLEKMPIDFSGARREGISLSTDFIVIGEYAENSARIIFSNSDVMYITTFYNEIPNIRHIHSICLSPCCTYMFVSTGDGKKYTDKWNIRDNTIQFSKRLRKRNAGFTASASINGEFFFGTDFSSRPNYIETLSGDKFMYPAPSYKMYVDTMQVLENRYIISLNKEHSPVGNELTVSIFDSKHKNYIYCDYLDLHHKNTANN